MKRSGEKSTLKVHKGVAQPPSVHPDSVKRFLSKKKPKLNPDEYVSGILAGNRTILSQAITLAESQLQEHIPIAQEIIARCLPYTGKSMRIGITGVPGVGKSSFIEAVGGYITGMDHKLAVLAIDPSSERTKGSILGDKTRMESLSADSNAFIRPSPSAGSLGGVAKKTRESMLLCEAAGFDVIFIETVGVGQSETTVHSMTDFFLLLMLAGAGDELQGIKRGIMEMADAIAITKSDGDNLTPAKRAMAEYRNALHLFPPSESGWTPEVMTVSSVDNSGLKELWNFIEQYFKLCQANGFLKTNRMDQSRAWMYETIQTQLMNNFTTDPEIQNRIKEIEEQVMKGDISSYAGAQELLAKFNIRK